jgi:hypothetical protein
MSELEARIIASTSAQTAPEEAGVLEASSGASPKVGRCGCAAHCKQHFSRRLICRRRPEVPPAAPAVSQLLPRIGARFVLHR